MANSKWRYGCDKDVEIFVTRGYSGRMMVFKCGSTGPTGDVVQCQECAETIKPPPTPEYGDYDTGPYDGAYQPWENY